MLVSWRIGRLPVDPSTRSNRSELYLFAWGFYLLLSIAGLIWIGVREGQISLGVFLDSNRWPLDLAIGLGVGLVAVGLWQVASRLPVARELERELAERIGELSTSEVLAMALLSGVGEELFFRGAMVPSLGLLFSSLIFAIAHTGPGRAFLLWTCFSFVAGLALGGIFLWRGNLLAPILAHVVINAIGLARLSRSAGARSA